MADKRALNRLFNQAYADSARAEVPAFVRKRKEDEEDEEVDPSEPARILAAFKKKDYFSCLSLPPVTLDEVGRPVWPCADADVSRAYRKASLRVHPDKNPAPDARAAFDALKEAQKALQDPSARSEALKEAGERELQRVFKEDHAAKVRIEKAREAARAAEYAAEVKAQAARAAEKARQQREAVEAAKRTREAESSDSDEQEWRGAAARRGGAAGRGGAARGRGRPRGSFIF